MKRFNEFLTELISWIVVLYLLGISLGLFALVIGLIWPEDLKTLAARAWWAPLIYALASASYLLAVYFIGLIWRAHRRRARIVRDGPGGPIRISPTALRNFIAEVLRRELGLSRFRLRLARTRKGMNVFVSISLSAEQGVVEIGKRIQELLKRRVEERIGVEVNGVEVFAKCIEAGPGEEREDQPPLPEAPSEATAHSEGSDDG